MQYSRVSRNLSLEKDVTPEAGSLSFSCLRTQLRACPWGSISSGYRELRVTWTGGFGEEASNSVARLCKSRDLK